MITELQLLTDRDLLRSKRKALKSFLARKQEAISTLIIFSVCVGLEVYAIGFFIFKCLCRMS